MRAKAAPVPLWILCLCGRCVLCPDTAGPVGNGQESGGHRQMCVNASASFRVQLDLPLIDQAQLGWAEDRASSVSAGRAGLVVSLVTEGLGFTPSPRQAL